MIAVAGVVIDHGKFARALHDQRINQLARNARPAEAADQHGRAILHSGKRCLERIDNLVHHGKVLLRSTAAAARRTAYNLTAPQRYCFVRDLFYAALNTRSHRPFAGLANCLAICAAIARQLFDM
jgi:hypothetical protein